MRVPARYEETQYGMYCTLQYYSTTIINKWTLLEESISTAIVLNR